MDEFFTFNSQQFQVIKQQHQHSTTFRKRIIKVGDSKKQVSVPTSPSTTEDNHSPLIIIQKKVKKVSFCESDSTEKEIKVDSPQIALNGSTDDKHMVSVQILESRSKATLFKKLSGQLNEKKERYLQNHNSSAEELQDFRRQRRIKSVKIAPKVFLPISDRKLPKAFKMFDCEMLFPKLIRKSQDQENVRQIHSSSQRRRKTFKFGQENTIRKRVFSTVERNSFTPQV